MNESSRHSILDKTLVDLLNKCDILFDGDLISKEKLLSMFTCFLCESSLQKHNTVIVLHTGSVCFDIILFIYAALNNILYGATTAYDYIDKMEPGTHVSYKDSEGDILYEFQGLIEHTEPDRWGRTQSLNEKRALLKTKDGRVVYVCQKEWGKIMPYYGEAKLGNRGIRSTGEARNSFLRFILEDKTILSPVNNCSTIIACNLLYASDLCSRVTIRYNGNREIKFNELSSISHFTEDREIVQPGNSGKNEAAIKVASSVAVAKELITGTWNGEYATKTMDKTTIGFMGIGQDTVQKGSGEIESLLRRKKLLFSILSYGILSKSSGDYISFSDDTKVFACTKEYLSGYMECSQNNEQTKDFYNKIRRIINKNVYKKTSDKETSDLKNYKVALAGIKELRKIDTIIVKEFCIHFFLLTSFVETAVFSLQDIDSFSKKYEVLSTPSARFSRLKELYSQIPNAYQQFAKPAVAFLSERLVRLTDSAWKKDKLIEILEKYSEKNIALILPSKQIVDYAAILRFLKIDEIEKNNLSIFKTTQFDPDRQYDVIISTGAGYDFTSRKFNPFLCNSSDEIYVLTDVLESENYTYECKLSKRLNAAINKAAGISCVDNPHSSTGTSDAGIIDAEKELRSYIEALFSSGTLLSIPRVGTGGSSCEISAAATCTDGRQIFFTKDYKANVLNEGAEEVKQCNPSELTAGSKLIFTQYNNNTKDIVSVMLDEYIKHGTDTRLIDQYEKSLYWRQVLTAYKENRRLTYKDIWLQMKKFGFKKTKETINCWINDTYLVGPTDLDDYIAIAKLTGDERMLQAPSEYYEACSNIRSIRIRMWSLIAKAIIHKYNSKNIAEDTISSIISGYFDEFADVVELEYVSPISESVNINMINRPVNI